MALVNLVLDEEAEATVELQEEGVFERAGEVTKPAPHFTKKRCKIDKLGMHIHLMFQQLLSWALSLVIYSFCVHYA